MSQRIDVPGMGIVEFPDGMSDNDIATAIRRNMPQEPAAPAAPDEGVAESLLIGAGRATDKLIAGAQQLYYGAKSKLEPKGVSSLIAGTETDRKLAQIAADQAEKDRLYKPLQDAHPAATAIGEMVPGLGVGAVTGGTTLIGGALAGGLPSLLSYGSAEDRLKRGATDALGGALGAKVGQLVAKVLKPATAGAQGVSDTALAAAERLGVKPTAAQITQNPGTQALENYLLRSPGSSGAIQRVMQNNQTALNRGAAKAMGETADSLDEGVFAAAKSRIGDEFDRLGQITKPDLSGNFLTTLAKIDSDNAARGAFKSGKVDDLVNKGLDLAANNNLTGQAYKEVRTELANQAQAAFRNGDATVGQAYKSLVASLDEAAKSTLSKADQMAWDKARKEWGAFKTLSKSNVAEAGNVSAARTAAAVRAKNPNFRAGGVDGELADIARVGEAFKGVGNPNSGQLAQIQSYANPLYGIPLALGNRAAAAAYTSPLGQMYLTRGLLDVGQTGQGLLGQMGAQLGAPYARNLLGVE